MIEVIHEGNVSCEDLFCIQGLLVMANGCFAYKDTMRKECEWIMGTAIGRAREEAVFREEVEGGVRDESEVESQEGTARSESEEVKKN